MKLKSLSGKEIKLTFSKNKVAAIDSRPRSSYHLVARQLIKRLYTDFLAEEVFIPYDNFYFDFVMPNRLVFIEVHGEQHYGFNPFFHKTKLDFVKQQKTDRNKELFCKENGGTYIELPYHESEDQWTRRLMMC